MSWRNRASLAALATATCLTGTTTLPSSVTGDRLASEPSLREPSPGRTDPARPTLGPATATAALAHPAAPATAPPTAAGSRAAGAATAPGPGAIGNQRGGIFALTGAANPGATVASLPPEVSGVSWMFQWSDIEPSPGVYNWAAIDAALKAAAASGRTSMLRVIAGEKSPSWVQPTLTFFDTPNGPVAPHQVTMPVPWSSGFLQSYGSFLAAYGARYDGRAGLYAVQLAGPGVLGEMTLGGWQLPGGRNGWTTPAPAGAGATDAELVSAWNTVIDASRRAFPHTRTALDLGEPLRDGNVQPAVLAHARSYGSAMLLQQNGLQPSTNSSNPYFRILSAASASTTVGWQMWGGGLSLGSLMSAFATARASHAGYVEVYVGDCQNPANAAALTYLAAG